MGGAAVEVVHHLRHEGELLATPEIDESFLGVGPLVVVRSRPSAVKTPAKGIAVAGIDRRRVTMGEPIEREDVVHAAHAPQTAALKTVCRAHRSDLRMPPCPDSRNRRRSHRHRTYLAPPKIRLVGIIGSARADRACRPGDSSSSLDKTQATQTPPSASTPEPVAAARSVDRRLCEELAQQSE